MNGWHETNKDEPGPDAICGHLYLIANPPAPADPPDACRECLIEGTTWVWLRRCLVCGHTGCCESSPRQHADRHFRQTGHPVMADQTDLDDFGWCYADGLALSPSDG